MKETILYHPYEVHNATLSNGCKIAYVDEGEGSKTILFVHGLASYALSWKKNIEYLKKHFRCIAIDLPGNGLSMHGDYPYGIGFFADRIYELTQTLGLKDICLAGHSMGGQTAMALLIKYPEAAKELILCAPAGFETFNSFEKMIYHSTIHFFDMFSSEENSLRKVLENSFYNSPSQANEMVKDLVAIMKMYPIQDYRKMIEACVKSLLDEPVYDKMHLIKQKTLVFFGDSDALIPNKLMHHYSTKKLAEDSVKQFPHASLRILGHCGHFLQWEKAAEVNQQIEKFLK